MAVPGDAVEDGLEHVDGDQSDTGFHQPTRQETALSEGRGAIGLTNSWTLVVQLKRTARGSSQERVGRPRQAQTTRGIPFHRIVQEAPSAI